MTGFTSWNKWLSENGFTFGIGWAVKRNAFISRATFIGVNKFFSLGEFVTSWFNGAFFSFVGTRNRSIWFTNTWLANVSSWDNTDWVLNTFVFTESASTSFVFTAALVGVSSFSTTVIAFLVFSFKFQ